MSFIAPIGILERKEIWYEVKSYQYQDCSIFLHFLTASPCMVLTGPAGQKKCMAISGYSGLQWATCLTSTFVERKSAGN